MKRRFKLQPFVPKEYDEQVIVMDWRNIMQHQIPELRLLVAIPNGLRTTMGAAVKMKKAGMAAGFPDLFLPVARGPWHGLLIEMKRSKGSVVSSDQDYWIVSLRDQGYSAIVCKGHREAITAIQAYLNLGKK